MAIWRLISHHEEGQKRFDVLNEYIKSKIIAIGWGDIGSIDKLNVSSAYDLGHEIRLKYPSLRNSNIGGPCLWHFSHSIKKNDLVIIKAHDKMRVVRVVDGKYIFNDNGCALANDYKHQLSVDPFWGDEKSLISNYKRLTHKFADNHPQRRPLSLTTL